MKKYLSGFAIALFVFALIVGFEKASAASSTKAFGGRITNTKATEIQSMESSNYKCTVPGNDDAWAGVTYGNGLFVAVSYFGDRVMTSPDGVTWTARSAAGDDDTWAGISYGNGLFVAVGSGSDSVMKSSDGTTWSTSSPAEANSWTSVTYGNGMFVAVSSDGTNRVMRSNFGTFYNNTSYYQGVSLVEITNASGTTVYGSTANPTRDTISVPLTTNTLTASTTNITYKVRITPKTHTNMPVSPGDTYPILAQVSTLTTSGGMVEGSDSASSTITIDNAITNPVLNVASWTERTATISGWQSVAYGNGTFVAVAISGTTQVMTSTDGINWTARTAAEANGWYAVTYGNGLFVAVTNTGSNRPRSYCIATALSS
jgi:hypothetical protein